MFSAVPSVLLGILLVSQATILSAGELENTFDIVSREAARQVSAIIDSIPNHNATTMDLQLVVAGHPDRAWLETQALRAIEQRSDIAVVRTDTTCLLELVVMDMSTKYHKTQSVDTVERVVTVAIEGLYKCDRQRRIVPKPAIMHDRCSRSEAERNQSLQLTATSAPLPELEQSTYEAIIEPVIFVAAAIVTIVLAFTVRSK